MYSTFGFTVNVECKVGAFKCVGTAQFPSKNSYKDLCDLARRYGKSGGMQDEICPSTSY